MDTIQMSKEEAQKFRMRDFLGHLVGQALGWHRVSCVTVSLELSSRFEDNGWDGWVRFRFDDGRDYNRIFTSFEVDNARIPGLLITALRERIEVLLKL